MEDSVLVIVGEWECCELGRWRFRVSRDEMARFVCLTNETSYETLVGNVVSAFNVEENSRKPCLSYLYETETTAFTQGKMPPVSISSDVGLRRFIKSRSVEKDMSIMLTLNRVVSCVGNGRGDGHVNVHESGDTISDDLLVAHMELVEAELMAKRIDEETNRGKVVNNITSPQRCQSEEMDGLSDEEYDFDKWTELINKEYPPDWDPFEKVNRQRRKRNLVEGEGVGEEDRGGGQKKCTPGGAYDFIKGGQQSGTTSGDIRIPTTELVVCNDGHGNGAGGIGINFSPLGFILGVEESQTNGRG